MDWPVVLVAVLLVEALTEQQMVALAQLDKVLLVAVLTLLIINTVVVVAALALLEHLEQVMGHLEPVVMVALVLLQPLRVQA